MTYRWLEKFPRRTDMSFKMPWRSTFCHILFKVCTFTRMIIKVTNCYCIRLQLFSWNEMRTDNNPVYIYLICFLYRRSINLKPHHNNNVILNFQIIYVIRILINWLCILTNVVIKRLYNTVFQQTPKLRCMKIT